MKRKLKNILVSLRIDPDRISRVLYGNEGPFEEHKLVARFLLAECKLSDGVMVDVGVAFGNASLPFLRNGWKVYGFEPDQNREKQSALSTLGKSGNFYLDERAVSDTSGDEVSFYTSEASSGISSLYSFCDHRESGKVQTVSLGDFVSEHHIDSIDFLKIDTEGHDLLALQGFPFDKIRPRIVVAEFDEQKSSATGYSFRELGDYLLEQGYHVYLSEWYPIVQYGGRHRFRTMKSYPASLHDVNAWGNYIAVEKNEQRDFKLFLESNPFKNFQI